MKVTDVKTFVVDCFRTNWVFIKVYTDSGINGVGEAILEYKDGFITIPDKPGLGIEIDEKKCLEHPYKPHTLRHYTASLTDIRPSKTEIYFNKEQNYEKDFDCC